MDAHSDSSELSQRLEAVLECIADPAFADKLRAVYEAAAKTIARLSDMDLLRYEATAVETSPDLSLWEELAPVMGNTVAEVNALLQVIRQRFSAQLPPLASGAPIEEFRKRDAEEALRAAVQKMSEDVTHLGQVLRNPSIMSDRWKLLSELQAFRSHFRDQIANLVYETAVNFDEVHRKEVVPGYEEEVRAAVLVRGAVADLARTVGERLVQLRDGAPEDRAWVAHQVQGDVDAFGGTDAYRALRAQDKRAIIEFRQALGTLSGQPARIGAELLPMVERFSKLVDGLNSANFKEVLIAHDREVWAECGVRIEHAAQIAAIDPPAASLILREAIALARQLYGRDSALDAFLRKVREATDSLSASSFAHTAEEFREVLASVAEL